MAETPAPTIYGAERVVVACEFEGDVSESLRARICDQLVLKARQFTDLPVSRATPADLSSDLRHLRSQRKQLRLRVKVAASDVEQGRKALRLEVSAERPGRPISDAGPIKSSANLVRAQQDWVLMGPVLGFQKLLGTGPRAVRTPIASE